MSNFKMSKEERRLIVICFFGTFVCFLNQTTVNPALPTIINDFRIDASTAQWLLSGYLLVMAIMIPINAFILEKYSVKSVVTFAITIYFCGCICTGLGLNFSFTFLGRILQGMGHGILMPTCMAVMLFVFPKEHRGSALGTFGLLVGFAPILGPTYSGFVVDHFGWHFVYYGIAFLSFIIWLGCVFHMPKTHLTKVNKSKLDIMSIVTSTLGFGIMLYGVSEFGSSGFSISALLSLFIGIIITIVFFVRQTKIDNPMLQVKVFKSKQFSVAIIVLCISQLAFMGAVVLFPFLIQDVLGFSPTVSGLTMIPSSIVMGCMSPITGRLFDKYGIRWLAIIGMTLLTLAGLFLSCLEETSPLYMLITFLCIRNLGASFVVMNTNTWGLNSLPKELLPHGNAVSSTFRQVSCSFAAAISTSIYTLVANQMPGGINVPSAGIVGINASFGFQSLICLFGLIICIIFVKNKKKN